MVEVTSSEFSKNFGRYRESAQREPVMVTNHNRLTGVLISPADYQEYVRLKQLATRALYVEELATETLEAISTARMDSRHDPLNALMDGD